jgi:phosphoethanolamine N-methyltransferase
MEHEAEYHDAMITMLELIWGAGFMVPGGEGNVDKLMGGLDVRGKRVLDFGCGIGGPAFVIAQKFGGYVVGTDLEAQLIERAERRAVDLGLTDRIEFRIVKAGPLDFPDASFDIIMSSGAFTQIDEKREIFEECLRVLRPGGTLTCYDWMKCEGEFSDDMLHWFEKEGLTYALETIERHDEILRAAGFADIELEDRSDWYERVVQEEYEKIKAELYPRMVESMGVKQADHFVENWRAMMLVCQKGEMLQVYWRARRPA